MAKTYYAWSRFNAPVDENGKAGKRFEPGDTISAGDLGVDEEEWKILVKEGAVREQPYPKNIGTSSPAEHFKKQLVKAGEGTLTADEYDELGLDNEQDNVAAIQAASLAGEENAADDNLGK